MRFSRVAAVLCVAVVSTAADKDPIADAAARLESAAAKAPASIAAEFRLLAAQALKEVRPERSQEFLAAALVQLRTAKDAPSSSALRMLATAAPAEAAALARKNAGSMPLVIAALAREKSPEAVKLFREYVKGISMAEIQPADAMALVNLAGTMAAAAPDASADALERLLTAAAVPSFGEGGKLSATFQAGQQTISTTTPRDTVLVAAGSRLMAVSRQRADKFREALSRWDLKGPVQLRSVNYGTAKATAGAEVAEAQKLQQRIGQFRGMATDADRAKAAIEVAEGIRALPNPQTRLQVAMSLSNLSTEGNLGKEALTAVGGALADSIQLGGSQEYLQLAKYVRYEHIAKPADDPALDAADALLALREAIQGGKEFTLTSMDGKTYSLAGLKGKVVLLNFWATWCPPCRKEMPDMEKLYREFGKDGFVVLAVSDEERETVEGFLKKEKYSFPVLLDPDRKVNTAFDVEGIPKSFLFDREGRIVARSIDMRTEPQFREMLKLAGLE